MLQCIQVLREVRVLILQLISPLPDLAHGSLVLTQLVLEKNELKLGQQASKHRQKTALYLARTAIAAIVLLRPWRRAQAMELALRLTSWLRMEGKDISMLCRSSSRSRTQLSHTARGTQQSARGPLPGLPAPRSPALQDTDLHTSCCLGRSPPGSRSRACRRRTASPSARWSRCTPRCAGHRSPLCTHILPSVITGKGPCHHFVLLPLLHVRDPAAGLTSAAPLAEAPVAGGTLLAAQAADAGQAAALSALHVAAAPHSTDVAVTPLAAGASLEAVVPLLGKSRSVGAPLTKRAGVSAPALSRHAGGPHLAAVAVLACHPSLAEALASLWMA